MKNTNLLAVGIIAVIITCLGLSKCFYLQTEMKGLRIACNNDAAGMLIKYLAGEDNTALKVVDMSYQQLQDCCSSQTELALAAGKFDMAVLCPDSAEKLIGSGQPYQILGAVVINAQVLVTSQNKIPRTVGYMNGREIQKELVWGNLNKNIVMKPIIPSGLPYALERNAVEGIILDILDALKISGYYSPLPSQYPTSVLVVHKDILNTSELASFVKAYNQIVLELNNQEILQKVIAQNLGKENGNKEVQIWRNMGIQFQLLELQS